jgi:hypothetical protein
MNFQNINKALNDFGKYVVQQSRSRLTKGNQGGGALYDSIRYTLDEEQKGFILDFYMEDYGKFQDQGVKGANPSLVKGGKQKAPNSKFSYKQKMPPMKPLMDWAQSKNIRFRDKEGKFKKGSYKSMAFVLQRSIYAQGFKPTYFFTKPFEAAFKRLPEELIKDFMLDIEKGIILGTKK